MDRSLDEIISDRPRGRGKPEARRPPPPPRAPRRDEGPRDGIRKVPPPSRYFRRDDRADIDSDWVHDRYEEERRHDRGGRRRHSPADVDRFDRAPKPEETGSRLRIDNLHYELTESDLRDLFERLGRVTQVKLMYDRMDRSEGTAFVTYEDPRDARDAVAAFDGQNANGQPIRLTLLPTAPAAKGTLFERVERPSRSLFDRIEGGPDSRDDSRDGSKRRAARSHSPRRKPTPEHIDRYVPGGRRPRSRSPIKRRGTPRDPGRRPGQRRDERSRGGRRGGRTDEEGRSMVGGRPRKTAEELDAEMADYWGKPGDAPTANGQAASQNGTAGATTAQPVDEDIDMIE